MKLPAGKYALKWHLPDEYKVKDCYNNMKCKLLRNPTPQEISGLIKERPNEARDLLFKYIPGYREPTEEEISSATNKVLGMVILGAWDELSSPNIKKEWFEQGIDKVIIEGIDQASFNELLENKSLISLDETRSYLEDFPEMKPKISRDREDTQISYKIEWPDDINNLLYSSDHWSQQFEVRVPKRFDQEKYQKYKALLDRNGDYALTRISKMASGYSLSQEVINDLLGWTEDLKKRYGALDALRYFCKNGLEVDQLDEKTQKRVVYSLLDSFFADKSNSYAYENALEIIEMLDVRNKVVAAKSIEFISWALRKKERDGRYQKLGEWLAKDPCVREELIEGMENVMANTEDDQVALSCKMFVKSIVRV